MSPNYWDSLGSLESVRRDVGHSPSVKLLTYGGQDGPTNAREAGVCPSLAGMEQVTEVVAMRSQPGSRYSNSYERMNATS